MTTIRGDMRLRYAWCGLLGLLGLTAAAALAQPTSTRAAAGSPWTARFTANEDTLWLVQSTSDLSRIFRRGVNGPFKSLEPLGAPVVSLATTGDGLYAFVEEGAFYRLGSDGWQCQLDLPERVRPLDMFGDASGVYVLIRSPAPGRLPRLSGGGGSPSSQPFDADGALLSVARYSSRGWMAVAACPTGISDGTTPAPQLGPLHDALGLTWYAADRRSVECVQFDAETSTWRAAGTLPVADPPSGLWLVAISRVPAIVVASPAADGAEKLSVFRLLGGAGGEHAEWRPGALHLSELPAGSSPGRYEAAFGFNQHVVLLMADTEGRSWLRFGRIDADPTEATLRVTDVFENRLEPGQGPRWVQSATLVTLFVILLALFVFRRGALATLLVLPGDCAPALTFQRLVGWVIDLAPFAFVLAAVMGVDWRSGLRELASWAPSGDQLPPPRTLAWWALSCGAATVYSLVMELLTQRTVGKVLMGTRILSEQGTPASALSIVIRNALRFLELLPPFWLLGFLVVLSRNRQRLGDIFARTIVVRRVRRTDEGPGRE